MTLFAALEQREELEERKRLLYVACTRAADYLILSSSLEAFDKPKSDWMKLLGERSIWKPASSSADLPDGLRDAANPRRRPIRRPTTNQPAARAAPTFETARRSPRARRRRRRRHPARSRADPGRPHRPPPILLLATHRPTRPHRSPARLASGCHCWLAQQCLRGRTLARRPQASARSSTTSSHASTSARTRAEIADWCEHLAPQHVVHNTERGGPTSRVT